MKPFRSELITIRKCEELTNRLVIAIDAGNVYTKVLFLNKTNKEQLLNDDEVSLNLELSVFHTEDFQYAIKWIRENAYMPEGNNSLINITGCFAKSHQNEIKSILKRHVLYIDEFETIAAGCKFVLECIGVNNLVAKPVHVESYGEVDSNMVEMLANAWKKKISAREYPTDGMHPCLVFVQGSSPAIYYFDENGSCEYFQSLHLGSRTLLGFCKCMSNTNNYNDIIDLVSKGNRLNVDNQTKDLIDENVDSPYGYFPPEMPALPFGKCVDFNIGLEVLKKEDVTNSVVSLYMQNIVDSSSFICVGRNIPKVYICGGIIESEVFRKELQKILNLPFTLINIDILDFDYSAVLGAMVFDDNIIRQYNFVT